MFDDLNNLTDIDNAVGQNLDMVGNIVSLTRKDATSIIRKTSNTILTDDTYRQTLRYKMLKNSSNCCYEDIMEAVSLLWDTSNIIYKEPPDRPATVLLSLPTVSLDSIDPAVGRVLAIKPAGVSIIYMVWYWSVIPLYRYERFLVSKINLLWEFSFYELATKNTKRLNGEWLLDGSIPLNGELINVPVKMITHVISTAHSECLETKHISGLLFEGKENVVLGSAKSNIEIPRVSVADAKAEITVEIGCKNEISCSLVTKKDMWHLDGSQLLDGNRCLDAIEIKEVI